jgi:predicted nuclease of predicted toxin-antitoxin system
MAWAKAHGYLVFTHDLDFGATLALTHADGPSVLQLRCNNVLAKHVSAVVLSVLKQHEIELAQGALVVVNETNSRIRVLPI